MKGNPPLNPASHFKVRNKRLSKRSAGPISPNQASAVPESPGKSVSTFILSYDQDMIFEVCPLDQPRFLPAVNRTISQCNQVTQAGQEHGLDPDYIKGDIP